MLTLNESTPLILAIVPNQASYDKLINEQQYCVPIRYMATVADVSMLACYMPGWHPTHPRHVTHVARIMSYSIQIRELIWPLQPHHPRATQPYVVLSLTDIELLTPPIPSPRWHRISIHRTTTGTLARMPYLGHTSLRRRHIAGLPD